MKLLLVLCLVAAVVAAPPPIRNDFTDDEDVQILRYENYDNGVGNHRYAYEKSDGTKEEQPVELKDEGREDAAYADRGSFMWISPKGDRYIVKYVAEKQEDHSESDEPPGAPSPLLCQVLCG